MVNETNLHYGWDGAVAEGARRQRAKSINHEGYEGSRWTSLGLLSLRGPSCPSWF